MPSAPPPARPPSATRRGCPTPPRPGWNCPGLPARPRPGRSGRSRSPRSSSPWPRRDWAPNRKVWAAAGICHKPLYFQDAALERYGQTAEQYVGPLGRYLSYPLDDPTQSNQRNQIAQPFFSMGLFAAQIAMLPYNMLVDPPWEARVRPGLLPPRRPRPHRRLLLPPPRRRPPVPRHELLTRSPGSADIPRPFGGEPRPFSPEGARPMIRWPRPRSGGEAAPADGRRCLRASRPIGRPPNPSTWPLSHGFAQVV